VRPEAGWPRGVAPVRTTVPCEGATHHVTWRRGSLVLEDHDAAADAVVVALGGDRPACLDVQRSWRLGYIEGGPPTEHSAVVRTLSSLARWMSEEGDGPVHLPEPLRRLREASVLHTWGRGLRDSGDTADVQRAFFERAVANRIRDLLRRSLRPLGAHLDAELDVSVGVDVEAEGRHEGTQAWARVRVPATWLTSVWVSELETWRGEVVLAVADRSPTWLDVARWEPDGELVVARVWP
jgi:hypothetical protein